MEHASAERAGRRHGYRERGLVVGLTARQADEEDGAVQSRCRHLSSGAGNTADAAAGVEAAVALGGQPAAERRDWEQRKGQECSEGVKSVE
jgi:hypothetical protein